MSYRSQISDCIYFWPEVKGGYQYDFLGNCAEIDAVMDEFDFTATHHTIRNVNRHQGFVRGGFAFGKTTGTKFSAYYEGVFGGEKFELQASWLIKGLLISDSWLLFSLTLMSAGTSTCRLFSQTSIL